MSYRFLNKQDFINLNAGNKFGYHSYRCKCIMQLDNKKFWDELKDKEYIFVEEKVGNILLYNVYDEMYIRGIDKICFTVNIVEPYKELLYHYDRYKKIQKIKLLIQGKLK